MQGIYPIRRFNLKLIAGIGVMMAVVGPLILSAILSLLKVAHAQHTFLTHEAEELRMAQELQCVIVQESADMPIYVFTGNTDSLQRRRQEGVKFEKTLGGLRKMVTERESLRLLDVVWQEHAELAKLEQPGIEMRKEGVPLEDVNRYFQDNTVALSGHMILSMQKFVDLTQGTFDREKEEILLASSRDIKFLAFAATMSFFLLLLVGALLVKLMRQKYLYDRSREALLDKETQLSQARKETVEIVAHDLKNPLCSILLSTQMALGESSNVGEENGENLRQALSITMRSAQSMEHLILDLLDHAKIEAGQLELDLKPCNLTALLCDVAERFKPIAESKHVRLVHPGSCCQETLEIDAARMEQVLSNLLGNAIKFTPPGGMVTLSCATESDEAIITVQDTGPGMTTEQVAHIFERYWQVRENARNGTGLGLSIAQAIVQAHTGNLKVVSEQGHGSSFSVHLPLQRRSPLS